MSKTTDSSIKTVLILGGAGSLGTALVPILLENTDATVRVLDSSEENLNKLQGLYGKEGHLRLFLGDVRELPRLRRAMEDVNIVYHLAALKHVWMGEYNPEEVLLTNVQGTQNVINAVLDEKKVQTMLYVSSDKAVNPTNFYGRSKAMAEDLVLNANKMKGDRLTAFSVYRPGNFFYSSGSVIEKWIHQRAANDTLTVVPGMRRYFMGLGKAAELLFECSLKAKGGEIWIPKCKEYSIEELAGLFSSGKAVEQQALRGDKQYEELYSEYEKQYLKDEGDMWIVRT